MIAKAARKPKLKLELIQDANCGRPHSVYRDFEFAEFA